MPFFRYYSQTCIHKPVNLLFRSYRMCIPKEEKDCSMLYSFQKETSPSKDDPSSGSIGFDDCGVDDVSFDSTEGRVMMHVFGNGKILHFNPLAYIKRDLLTNH